MNSANDSDKTQPLPPLLHIPALVIFALLFITVALQFFTRYVLNDSLGWTEEIARYFLILLGFAGGIICVCNNSNIALEFLSHRIPTAAVAPLKIFCHLITIAFFFYCGYLAIELAQRTNSNMASINLPKAVIYYTVSLACLGMAFVGCFMLARHRQQIISIADSNDKVNL